MAGQVVGETLGARIEMQLADWLPEKKSAVVVAIAVAAVFGGVGGQIVDTLMGDIEARLVKVEERFDEVEQAQDQTTSTLTLTVERQGQIRKDLEENSKRTAEIAKSLTNISDTMLKMGGDLKVQTKQLENIEKSLDDLKRDR